MLILIKVQNFKCILFILQNNALSSITLPTGSRLEFISDSNGGLKTIRLPSGAEHDFRMQNGLAGRAKLEHWTPGHPRDSGLAFVTYTDSAGRVLQTRPPVANSGMRVFTYDSNHGGLSAVASGDGLTRYFYDNAKRTKVEVEDSYGFSMKLTDLPPQLGDFTLGEQRIDFGPKTGLASAHFSYSLDSSGAQGGIASVSLSGRVGGVGLNPTLSVRHVWGVRRNGDESGVGQFTVQTHNLNGTTVSDGECIKGLKYYYV